MYEATALTPPVPFVPSPRGQAFVADGVFFGALAFYVHGNHPNYPQRQERALISSS
ncbi:hypothetical protein LZ32DRAFT_601283 [Colletotrichum eremochloae]|nr:hypothetical protein LZ32DRAFT_601283 [Colletotrichum eremochloae]